MSVTDRPRHSVQVLPDEAAQRQGAPAGVVSRTLAMAIDAAYAGALVGIGFGLWAGVRLLRNARSFSWPELSPAALVTTALVVAVLVLTASWTTTGRSPGARVMGLRVLAAGGVPPRLVPAFVRAVACVAFPLGLFWSAISRRNASVQDLVLRTSVVYDWHERN